LLYLKLQKAIILNITIRHHWACLNITIRRYWTCLNIIIRRYWACLNITIRRYWAYLNITIRRYWACLNITIRRYWACLNITIRCYWACLKITIRRYWACLNITIKRCWVCLKITIRRYWVCYAVTEFVLNQFCWNFSTLHILFFWKLWFTNNWIKIFIRLQLWGSNCLGKNLTSACMVVISNCTLHTCEPSGGSIFLPILRVPSVPLVNFQNLPPVKKIQYNKILTYILRSIFLEIPGLAGNSQW
jgi:hypothetical protein